jgi:hypothetical protein
MVRMQERADLVAVMETVPGRRVIHRLLEKGGIFRLSFKPGMSDVTAFQEGERNQALQLFVDVNKAAPGLYLTMMREAEQQEQVRKAQAGELPAEEAGDDSEDDDDEDDDALR